MPAKPCLEPGCAALVQPGQPGRGRCPAHQRPTLGTANWRRLSQETIARQPWCTWCGTTGTPQNPLTADHLTARIHGGKNEPPNLVTACRRCNSQRGAAE